MFEHKQGQSTTRAPDTPDIESCHENAKTPKVKKKKKKES